MTRLWELGGTTRALAFVALGILAGLGQAPQDAWYITILAFTFAFWAAEQSPNRAAVARLWSFVGLGYFAFSLRWIVEPFLVDVARHGWMAPFAILFMAGGFALFWGVAAAIAARFGRGLALVAALAGAEALRSLILSGFPWALAGHIWIETPMAQLSAFLGPHGLSVLTFGLAASIAQLLQKQWFWAAVPVLCLVAWPFLIPASNAPSRDRPIVRIVHPNIPQQEKWDPALRARNFDHLLRLSQGEEPVDLVIWPESAITELMENAYPAFNVMSDIVGGAPMITGVQRRSEAQLYHNAFAVLGRGGQVDGLYDKQHLVPFGEYIPGGEIAARFGLRGLAASEGGGFTAGSGEKTLTVPGVGLIRPLICYEAIFPEEVRTPGARPDLMVVITNDAWFGTGPGPTQHLRQAQLLSITFGLPLVRSANSGISAIIDGHGRILDEIGLDRAGTLEGAIPPPLPETVYARFGDAPTLVAITMLFLIGSVRLRKSH